MRDKRTQANSTDWFLNKKALIAVLSLLSSVITIYVFATGQSSISQIALYLRKRVAGPRPASHTIDRSVPDAQMVDSRLPYEEYLIERLDGCDGMLRREWMNPFDGDSGQSMGPGDPDPWLECQNKYMTVLIERFKVSLERYDFERKAEIDFSPRSSERFESFQADQEIWERYRDMRCQEEAGIEGAQGSGGTALVWSCLAELTEERITIISRLKRQVDEDASTLQYDLHTVE